MHDASIIWYCEEAETTKKDFKEEIEDLQKHDQAPFYLIDKRDCSLNKDFL